MVLLLHRIAASLVLPLFEELILHVDKDEMARLLDLEPGFTVQQIEEEGETFRLIFSRRTDLTEQHPRREDRRKGMFEL